MKKIIAMVAVAASVSTVAMAKKDVKNTSMTGFYLGVNSGYGVGAGDAAKMDGVIFAIHGGYQKDFGKFVAGLEIEDGITNQKVGSDLLSIKRSSYFGVALRLGAKLNKKWLAYAKAGWQNSEFTLNFLEIPLGSKRLNAFVPGLGIETMLSHNIMLGAEWTYAIFPKYKGEKIRSSDVKVRLSYKF